MRCIFLSILLILSTTAFSQSPATSFRRLDATEVKTPVAGSREFAALQSASWKQFTEANPSYAPAWLNYYIWTERDRQQEVDVRKELLKNIERSAYTHISDKWEYALISFLHSGERDSVSIQKALNGSNNKKIVYPYAIRFAIAMKDEDNAARWSKAFNALAPMSAVAYEYYYNVLMSADSNATVYAAGLNDLVPLAIMQRVHGIRNDIRLVHFDQNTAPEKGEYICLSLGAEVLSRFPNAAYTGLLARIGAPGSGAELKRHFENDFDLKILHEGTYLASEVVNLYSNYLPGLLLLYKQYKKENDEQAINIKTMIMQLAGPAGKTDEINKLMD